MENSGGIQASLSGRYATALFELARDSKALTQVEASLGNVRKALDALPQREREVIEMRFGLSGGRPRTLEEVGRAFNVTRERIRQIENHTLKKLESLPEAQRLRDTA